MIIKIQDAGQDAGQVMLILGKDSKTRVTGIVRKRGGVPPFPLIFFRYFFRPLWGGGGVPPLSANFFQLVFPSAMGGRVPPLSANFFSVSF